MRPHTGSALARRAFSDDDFSPSKAAVGAASVKDFLLQPQQKSKAPAPTQPAAAALESNVAPPAAPRAASLPALEGETIAGKSVPREIADMDVESKVVPSIIAVVLTLVVLGAVGFGVVGGLKEAAKDRQALGPGPTPTSATLITSASGSARR